jgi:hypothetical protein
VFGGGEQAHRPPFPHAADLSVRLLGSTREGPMGITKKGKTVAASRASRQCGLCGQTGRLTRAECCGNWLCDDEENYVLFSYARNSCDRNHRRFTLCGYHHAEDHRGSWKDCAACRGEFDTEMYVYYGTNEYNFEKLANPPSYEPTKCSACGQVIKLGEDGYSQRGKEYWCQACSERELTQLLSKMRSSEPNTALQRSVSRVTPLAKKRKGHATRRRR